MNTIENWLNLLPEPYKSQALKNMDEGAADYKIWNMKNAITCAFDPDETPEGADYWWKAVRKFSNIKMGDLKPEFGNKEQIQHVQWGKTEREQELEAYLDEEEFDYDYKEIDGKIQIIITL